MAQQLNADFVRSVRQPLGQFRGGRPQALGILFRRRHRHVQKPGPVDQKSDIRHQPRRFWNLGQQFFLHVNDEQRGFFRN